MNRFEYVSPATVAEAVKERAGGAVPKAGGIDLVARMKDRLDAPAKVLNLLKVDGLRTISADDGGLRVGALSTLAELSAHPGARKWYTALAQSAGEAATPQIRNVATVGGNLCQRPRCWYFRAAEYNCLKKGGGTCYAVEGENQYHAIFGSGPCHIVHPSNLGPALVALDGKVVVRGPQGERTLTAAEFFTPPGIGQEHALKEGELVTAIEASPGWRSAYVEVRERQSFDWPLAAAAVAVKGDEVRIVLGAVADRPWRHPGAEKAMGGGRLDDASIAKAAEAATKGAQPMAKNAYKLSLVRAVVQDALKMLK